MKREALRTLDATLEKKRITPEEFFQVIRTAGVHSDFKRWKTKIQAAYQRQTQKFKRQMRSEMLSMYASLKEWETARQFLSIHRPSSLTDFLLGMDVLLELDQLEDAKVLARRCKRLLSRTEDPFERSMLLEALARFSARTHNWSAAIEYWRQAPLDQPFRRNALSGIVKIHLGRAWEAIERGLQLLSELRQKPNIEDSIALPNNEVGLTRGTERQLLKFKRGISRLLSEKARKELGMAIETNQ
jgi:hypothetical protein